MPKGRNDLFDVVNCRAPGSGGYRVVACWVSNSLSKYKCSIPFVTSLGLSVSHLNKAIYVA